MFLTQAEYNVAKQTSRFLYSKIVLLSKNFEQIGELTGNVIGNPSFSISSDSDIRRTCSISLIPTDSSFDIDKGNKIWFDKYIQIWKDWREFITHELEKQVENAQILEPDPKKEEITQISIPKETNLAEEKSILQKMILYHGGFHRRIMQGDL